MQTFTFSKKLSLALMLCIGAAPLIGENSKKVIVPLVPTSTTTRIIGGTILATTLITFLRLITKKTAPKRVYPKDDSLNEQLWYAFDELLVGQAEKGERPDKLVINEENPNELVYKYSKVEARGVAGILYSTLKPIIIPALTLLVLLNKSSSDIVCGYRNALAFGENPILYFQNLLEECSTKSDVVGQPKLKNN
jgi:hypothetical protein